MDRRILPVFPPLQKYCSLAEPNFYSIGLKHRCRLDSKYLFKLRYFQQISSRATAALVKTTVANYFKAHDILLPIDENQCVVIGFDLLVFIAVPVMAVLKMFVPSSKSQFCMFVPFFSLIFLNRYRSFSCAAKVRRKGRNQRFRRLIFKFFLTQ